MDYASKLVQLEYLRDLVDQYLPQMYGGTEEGKRLHQDICETYGQVADVFEEVIGKERIQVPARSGSGPGSVYPNYFEAGFLSGVNPIFS